jgi:hypothetical protein
MNATNIEAINLALSETDLTIFNKIEDTNLRWLKIKEKLSDIIDFIAPLTEITIQDHDQTPWFDSELLEQKHFRDIAYKRFSLSKTDVDHEIYVNCRQSYQKLFNFKIIEYFKDKSINDFKNSKKFWEFYSAHIKLRSDKSGCVFPTSMLNGNELAFGSADISKMFNFFFSSLNSESSANIDECIDFSTRHLKNLINCKKLNPKQFKFRLITNTIVEKTIASIETRSGPGVSGIPTKIIKQLVPNLIDSITHLFNDCILTGNIPLEWKSALLTPLFKGKKLNPNDVNSYRGISVLPPIAKIFEKILATQIIIYFNTNNLFYPSQHGFRNAHSCESALHEIISEMNEIRSKRLVGLYLFIDFRKAFDLVDSEILITKLKFYGFDDQSLFLILNYFSDRQQSVIFNGSLSSPTQIRLGVPQGSVLGPLFFNIFINDLPYYLKQFTTRMFADDTTLSMSDSDYESLILKFNASIATLNEWCTFNRTDINWSKTEIMFICKKMAINKEGKFRLLEFPPHINILGNDVKVVNSFKLLGIIIDNKLDFRQYASELRKNVYSKLYSIKNIFYLSFSVKLQFFKTFILPYFDYCSTLSIYFTKSVLQKISNYYYLCLSKLLNFKCSHSPIDFNNVNNILEKMGLNALQHRIFIRLMNFSHKIYTGEFVPVNLRNKLTIKSTNQSYSLRSNDKMELAIPIISYLNNYGERTFEFFFSNFINKFCLNDLSIPFKLFKLRTINNVNIYYNLFKDTFKNFDLNYIFY